MRRNYLFGPVTPSFAEAYLSEPRRRGECLAFDAKGELDVAIGPSDTWESVTARLPRGWSPNFVCIYLPYTSVSECLWTAPVPVIGLAADWNLLWSHFRHCMPRLDRILTDTVGVEVMHREGIEHARVANLYGLGKSFLAEP